MKTWKRYGYEAKDGTLYIGAEAGKIARVGVFRIMCESDFIKMQRVYDAAMAEPEVSERLAKACDKAMLSRNVKK